MPKSRDQRRSEDQWSRSKMPSHSRKRRKVVNKNVTLKLDEHKIPMHEFCKRFEANPEKGLTEEQAKKNLEEYGKNIVSPPIEPHAFSRYFVNNFQGLAGIAWIAITVCFTTYVVEAYANVDIDPDIENVYLAVCLGCYIVINGTVSFIVERRATRLLKKMKGKIGHRAIVIRDGLRKNIDVSELTVGDLVQIHAGDKIPADIRVTKCTNFKVDKSNLTGETVPADIDPECSNDNPLLTSNLVFHSTFALEGTCEGIIFNVGDATVVGHIPRYSSYNSQVQTILSKSIIRIILFYSAVGMAISLTFCILYMRFRSTWLQTILIFVAIYIACVPEHLLVATLVILTIAGKQMQHLNCLPKHFHTIQTLASIAFICTDKTGVLTQSFMVVSQLWMGQNIKNVQDENFKTMPLSGGFSSFIRCVTLCAKPKPQLWGVEIEEASATEVPKTPVVDVGNTTKIESVQDALVNYLKKFGYAQTVPHFKEWVDLNPIYESTFNASKKYYFALHNLKEHSRQLGVMMGSPEVVFRHCSFIVIGSNKYPITEKIRAQFALVCEEIGSSGEKIYGFADYFLDTPFNPKLHVHKHNFRFLGLISMQNLLRPTIPNTISRCHAGSIRVIMITRDRPSIAKAIALQAGILTDEVNGLVITGEQLNNMEPDELTKLISENKEIVFAQTSPQDKLLIVKCCQKFGKVAVTGDDVKDCPALKTADIGMATANGSDIVKQAADLILLDHSLTPIVAGIEQGRLVYENLAKCIKYTLSSAVPQLAPFFLFMFFQIPRPLGAFSVLLISTATDLMPIVALGHEKPEYDMMKILPREMQQYKLLKLSVLMRAYFQIGMIQALAGLFAYTVVLMDNGFNVWDLINTSSEWDIMGSHPIVDSYGQEWNFYQRKELEFSCHSAFCFAVILTQVVNMIVCRTRHESVFHHGFNNWYMNAAIVFAFGLAFFICNLPAGHFENALKHRSIMVYWYFPSLPFAFLIFFYEELRGYFIRKNPNGWVAREFDY